MTSSFEILGKTVRYAGYWCRRCFAPLWDPYSPAVIPIHFPPTPNRIDFLNSLLARFENGSYLEIGCEYDACFSRIVSPRKVGVDPRSGGTVRARSDEFFARNDERFDVVFIDGLHRYHQVVRDVRNSLDVLNPSGVIVLHDCLPLTWSAHCPYRFQNVWNGDVWRALVEIRTWPDVDSATCLIDHGLGIVVPRANTSRLAFAPPSFAKVPFAVLAADYQRLLRTIDYEAGLRFALGATR